MREIIILLTNFINDMHDFINYIVNYVFQLNLTDKDLHFWVMGIIGFTIFIFVLLISNYISQLPYGITILSFLYTFTFMVVLVFAIEIQQAITNRGAMEFEDAVIGLWGFLVFFFWFVIASSVFIYIRRLFMKLKRRKR